MVGKNTKHIASANFEIELETLEHIKSLFGSLEPGRSVQFCDGNVELKLISTDKSLGFDGGFIVELILAYSDEITIGVIGSAIYDVIRTGIKKLEINGRRTRTRKEDIAQTLETLKNIATDNEKINNKLKKKKSKSKKKKKKE